jgi:glyoxylase-like metal-dependent hydrolase (beta-lactamase superfamily II)
MANELATQSWSNGITRRTLLRTLPALVSLPLAGGLVSRAYAQTASSFKVGQIEITVITDGVLTLPLAFALPGRDKAEINDRLAKAGLPVDMISSQVNVAIIKTADAVILVDTGGGPDFVPSIGKLADNLDASGIAAEKITHVVFTHAHADHLWGVIDPLDGGSRYTNAKHVMAEAEAAYWTKPDIETEVPEIFKTMAIGSARRLKALGDRVERVKPGAELVSGVQLVDTGGHTPGHMSVLVRSGSEQLLIGGDVLTNPVFSFENPSWRWGPDMEPERAIASRLKTLQMLAAEKTQILGYHLPWPGVGRVEAKDSAFRFVQG